MSTVNIQYEITRSLPASGVYAVEFRVTSADNIERELFVFDTQYQAFVGVATVYGMNNYLPSRDQAIAAGLDFFRAIGVVRTFTTIADADSFVSVTRSRLEALRREWQQYVDDYPTYTIVVTPEPE